MSRRRSAIGGQYCDYLFARQVLSSNLPSETSSESARKLRWTDSSTGACYIVLCFLRKSFKSSSSLVIYRIASTTRLTESSACVVVVLWCHEMKDHRKQSLNGRNKKSKKGGEYRTNIICKKISHFYRLYSSRLCVWYKKAKVYIYISCFYVLP